MQWLLWICHLGADTVVPSPTTSALLETVVTADGPGAGRDGDHDATGTV